MKPSYWATACRELSASDPILKEVIATYDGEFLASRGKAFETLFRSIVGQQISVVAAQSVWNRVILAVQADQPEKVLVAESSQLRACGLSERKVEYAKALAQAFIDKKIIEKNWPGQSDDEIIEALVSIRGIGRWTAEMFLIFHLMRPDIFPKADLAIQKAIAKLYKKKYPMSDRQLEIFRKKYSPWGSVASWYLWRTLDPIPVEY